MIDARLGTATTVSRSVAVSRSITLTLSSVYSSRAPLRNHVNDNVEDPGDKLYGRDDGLAALFVEIHTGGKGASAFVHNREQRGRLVSTRHYHHH